MPRYISEDIHSFLQVTTFDELSPVKRHKACILQLRLTIKNHHFILSSASNQKMKFSFEAMICKVGINPCVDVPLHITGKMVAAKGYIPIKGKIKNHSFQQTLVPVKNAAYRLYVNGPMLKGSDSKVGDVVQFIIEQNFVPAGFSMPRELKIKLTDHGLLPVFNKLTPGRQKEILRYLGFLKTGEALTRNINKVIDQLKKKNNH